MSKIEEPPFQIFKYFDGTDTYWSVRDRRAGHQAVLNMPLFNTKEKAEAFRNKHNTNFTLTKFIK